MQFHAEAKREVAAVKQRQADSLAAFKAKEAAIKAAARAVVKRIHKEGGDDLAWAVYHALKVNLKITW
jgi:hypothetical protein